MSTVTVHVLRAFDDYVARRGRKPGDVFTATEERAAYIDGKLPGYITYERIEEKVAPDEASLKKMTVAQLTELAQSRGVDLKGRKKKAQIIELLIEG